MNKKIICFVGITSIELFIFALTIILFEKIGIFYIYVSYKLSFGLTTMDLWMITIIVNFLPVFLIQNLILIKLKIIKLK